MPVAPAINQRRKRRLNPLQVDPTRTTLLRQQLGRDLAKRFRRLRGEIRRLVAVEDAFGLRQPASVKRLLSRNAAPVFNVRFAFETDAGKQDGFRRWLKERVELGIFEVPEENQATPWLSDYITSGYRKGVVRAFNDASIAAQKKSFGHYAGEELNYLDFTAGTKEAFIESAFLGPTAVGQLEALHNRAFGELRGVTGSMGQSMGRVLADGLAAGSSADALADRLNEQMVILENTRVKMIARTEIIRSHAEGQLDAFERMGVEQLTVMAEWHTAQDGKVCRKCGPLQGMVLRIGEARGMLPRHPNCRCSWLPHQEEKEITDKDLARRVHESTKEENPGATNPALASSWVGADAKSLTRVKLTSRISDEVMQQALVHGGTVVDFGKEVLADFATNLFEELKDEVIHAAKEAARVAVQKAAKTALLGVDLRDIKTYKDFIGAFFEPDLVDVVWRDALSAAGNELGGRWADRAFILESAMQSAVKDVVRGQAYRIQDLVVGNIIDLNTRARQRVLGKVDDIIRRVAGAGKEVARVGDLLSGHAGSITGILDDGLAAIPRSPLLARTNEGVDVLRARLEAIDTFINDGIDRSFGVISRKLTLADRVVNIPASRVINEIEGLVEDVAERISLNVGNTMMDTLESIGPVIKEMSDQLRGLRSASSKMFAAPMPPPPRATPAAISKMSKKQLIKEILNDTTSVEAMSKDIIKVLEGVRVKELRLFALNGNRLTTSDMLTDAWPELKGQQPPGYPAGYTWDFSPAGYNFSKKEIVIPAFRRDYEEKKFLGFKVQARVKVAAQPEYADLKNSVLHEMGHSFDAGLSEKNIIASEGRQSRNLFGVKDRSGDFAERFDQRATMDASNLVTAYEKDVTELYRVTGSTPEALAGDAWHLQYYIQPQPEMKYLGRTVLSELKFTPNGRQEAFAEGYANLHGGAVNPFYAKRFPNFMKEMTKTFDDKLDRAIESIVPKKLGVKHDPFGLLHGPIPPQTPNIKRPPRQRIHRRKRRDVMRPGADPPIEEWDVSWRERIWSPRSRKGGGGQAGAIPKGIFVNNAGLGVGGLRKNIKKLKTWKRTEAAKVIGKAGKAYVAAPAFTKRWADSWAKRLPG